jgi:site-specific DNA-cytosine methylase
MGTTLVLLEGLGYKAVAALDSPIRHGIPQDRKRVSISALRPGLADKWGLHAANAPVPPHTGESPGGSGRVLGVRAGAGCSSQA